MKIVFFIGTLRGGGAERVLSILANHYCSLGHKVEIALLFDTEIGYPINNDIRIVDLSVGTGSYTKRALPWLLSVRRYLKKSKPDTVVSFIGRINVLVLTASIGLKHRTIVSERNDPRRDGRSKLWLWLCNKSYKKADAIVFQTKYEKSCFSHCLDSKSHVIANPVSVSVSNKQSNDIHIVTAGRLLPQKNHKMLIQAFSYIKNDFPKAQLTIYGEGILRQELQELIDSLGLSDCAHMPGNVTDLHERISSASLFVMTSEYEGLSNALIEALMIGLPCITTNYPGAEEIIKNNENGLVVERNRIDDLVIALKNVLTNRELRNTLIRNGKESAKRFAEEGVLNNWDRVILEE